MPSRNTPAVPSDLRTALIWGLDHPVDGDASMLANVVARAFGSGTVAVIHYGSRAQGRQPRADSAFDFFVVVDRYGDAYRSLAATVGTSYAASVATALSHVLAPNVIAVTDRKADGRSAKCCVISLADFSRACSPRRHDHFVQGRLFQFVLIAWARDAECARTIREAVADARAGTFAWGRPSLPERFTVEAYVLALLARSLEGEIRPEVGDHAMTLVTAQQEALRAIYTPLLKNLVEQGALVVDADGQTYHQRLAPTRLERFRVALYFHRSKLRATLRLLKHVILYEGWLDYIVRKIERGGDTPMVLTRREQRWPLIFLWPRVFQYLRTRPQRRRNRDSD